MKVRLHEPSFGREEIDAAVAVLESTNVTSGKLVKEFEYKFGANSVMCNSGSSANLLAIAALCNPLTPNHFNRGDEIIVSALSWSTTVWPLVQYGLIPVIVDICPDALNIDPLEIRKAISPKTRAIMPVHVYGNPCDMQSIKQIAEDHDLVIIEDCCEASPKADIGHSDYNTYSFYFSHHITSLEGGMVTCKTVEQADMLRTLRCHGWTREQVNRQHYEGIDDNFLFVNCGYNLRSTELNAAIGLVQYEKLDGFVLARQAAAEQLSKPFLNYYHEYFSIQRDMGSSWFGFPVIVNDNAPFSAREVRNHFENDGIETRPLICGNIARQPGMKLWPHIVSGDLKNADHVMKNGFSVGCHQAMANAECSHVAISIKNFMDKYDRA